jgi:polyisoprenoid-binding protein YceI
VRTQQRVMSFALAVVAWANTAWAAEYRVDGAASHVTFHVGKTGMMSGVGHEHDVQATGFDGTVVMDRKSVAGSGLSLWFPSSGLKVIPDKEPSGDAPKVQAAMEGPECLDVKRFPSIEFRSTKVAAKPSGDNVWNVTISGELELHGQRKPITIPATVSVQGDTLTTKGKATIKQSDFGITPISAAGGTVKVKDELAMTFTIVAKGPPAAEPAP